MVTAMCHLQQPRTERSSEKNTTGHSSSPRYKGIHQAPCILCHASFSPGLGRQVKLANTMLTPSLFGRQIDRQTEIQIQTEESEIHLKGCTSYFIWLLLLRGGEGRVTHNKYNVFQPIEKQKSVLLHKKSHCTCSHIVIAPTAGFLLWRLLGIDFTHTHI